jgi:hypothetical protein
MDQERTVLFVCEHGSAKSVVAVRPLPEAYGGSRAIEIRGDVPPVSENYERARDAIVERIERLLDELGEPARGAAGGPAL